jgi:hypothetical protein
MLSMKQEGSFCAYHSHKNMKECTKEVEKFMQKEEEEEKEEEARLPGENYAK